MDPGYIKIFCCGIGFSTYDVNYTICQFDEYLKTINHIHKLTIFSDDPYDFYESFINAEHITVNKIVAYANIQNLIRCFKRIEIIELVDIDPPIIPYPIKIYSRGNAIDKLYLHYENEHMYYQTPDPDIKHIHIYVSETCTNEMLSTILSHPFEKINISFNNYFINRSNSRHIEMSELVDSLIANPAKHIYIRAIGPDYDDLLRLIAKPNIISLRLNYVANPHIIQPSVFEDNFTILRFYIKGEHYFQNLPLDIYERNLRYLNDQRFKKTKVASLCPSSTS